MLKKQIRWEPVLKGSLKTQAVEAIEAIAEALRNAPPAFSRFPDSNPETQRVEDASLSGGRAGYALLFEYLGRSKGHQSEKEYATTFLEEAFEVVADVQMSPALYGGFTGIAWAASHVCYGTDDDLAEVDRVLADYVKRSPWRVDYDLISGLVGMGVYALERLENRRESVSARRCLERIVNRLEETAVDSPEGFAWFTSPELLPEWQREKAPKGYYNLGLAHGVPGVIALLGHVYAAGIQKRKTIRLLQGSVNWLINQKLPSDSGVCFSSWTGPGIDREPSRSAWCYGDAGIAIALLSAARSVGEKSWEEEALKIARHAANRPPDQTGVRDPGLCHGSAGLAHIFNRIYQATGEALFQKAARFWCERTLQFREPGKGIAGFQSYFPEQDGTVRWIDDPGLLTGAAGIALALHAASTDVRPQWDRFLLTDVDS